MADRKTSFDEGRNRHVIVDFVHFLWENKLWWLIPMGITLLLLAILIAIAGITGNLSPFIYSLF